MKTTPLHHLQETHQPHWTSFAGWEMALHYGSQVEEHHAVRQRAGLFDVSHMLVCDVLGPEACEFFRHTLANDVARLKKPGRALYSCMLNPEGGIIDDVIVYYLRPNQYRIISNAGTAEQVFPWLTQQIIPFDAKLLRREELALIAVQGPQALALTVSHCPRTMQANIAALTPFSLAYQDEWMIAKSGYTGEDGLEICLPADAAQTLWQTLIETKVPPCGLGARDTLRLEAGLNLYGTDMDHTTTPFESNLAWTVRMEPNERYFVGRAALEKKSAPTQKLTGIILRERGVLRGGQKVLNAEQKEVGYLTSGGFSPTLGYAIGLARVDNSLETECYVEIRGQQRRAQCVKPPFVRQGNSQVQLEETPFYDAK